MSGLLCLQCIARLSWTVGNVHLDEADGLLPMSADAAALCMTAETSREQSQSHRTTNMLQMPLVLDVLLCQQGSHAKSILHKKLLASIL